MASLKDARVVVEEGAGSSTSSSSSLRYSQQDLCHSVFHGITIGHHCQSSHLLRYDSVLKFAQSFNLLQLGFHLRVSDSRLSASLSMHLNFWISKPRINPSPLIFDRVYTSTSSFGLQRYLSPFTFSISENHFFFDFFGSVFFFEFVAVTCDLLLVSD
ncbi:unnamed protein product [Vicia faba]|uniref:Uncharacterized protein n=1 Tax=Vicia faba TaxID=3906 RepID=A0AAV0Z600_VICFA|nr:unnamed protein product [Vicia faba]